MHIHIYHPLFSFLTHGVHPLQKLPEAVDPGGKRAQGLELVHDKREVAQDVVEGAVRLANLLARKKKKKKETVYFIASHRRHIR